MKGLKIIPLFLLLMVLTYAGMMFVQANPDEVIVKLGTYQSPPVAMGFVVLTSIFVGMLLCGLLCSVELMALYVQNRRLQRRLAIQIPSTKVPLSDAPSDIVTHRTSGRFT